MCLHTGKWYGFEVDGKPGMVGVVRHLDALRVLDFDNRINKDGLEHPIDKFSGQALRMSYEVNPSALRREMIVDNYMLNVELPSMLEHLNEREREIIGKVDGVRKIRNAVIHKGADVSQREAADAINYVGLLITMLRARKAI
jgi:hypothetical protein